MIPMRSILTLAGALLLQNVSLAQWTQLFHPLIERCEDLFFLNADTGFAAGGGSGRILRTYDGGDFWWVVGELGDSYLRSIEFLDAQNGFCGSLDGQLYRTTDGGNSWTDIMGQLPQPVPGICGLSAPDASTIYGSGVFFGPAYVVKSADGGDSWQHIDLSAMAWCLVDVHFLNADTGFAVGGGSNNTSGASIFRTEDGGATWSEVFTTGTGYEWFWKIQSPDGVHLYASIESAFNTRPRIAISSDAGLSWTLDTVVNNNGRLQGVGFLTPEIGWTGDNVLFGTTDGGETWSTTFQVSGFNRFHRVSDQLAFAGGYGIFRFGPLSIGVPDVEPLPEKRDVLALSSTVADAPIRLNVELLHRSLTRVAVHAENGSVVRTVHEGPLPAGEHSFTLDMAPFASGTYIVSLYTNLGFVTQKVLRP